MPETENTSTTEQDETYESMTVAELKEELAARDLHTSGNKEELITRLEEDDVAAEQEQQDDEPADDDADDNEEVSSTDLVATSAQVDTLTGDPYKRVYSPYELPADPIAAQVFMDTHPGDVDDSVTVPDPEEEAAIAAIQDRMDFHASMGTPVPDSRVPGGTDPPPDPVLDALHPPQAEVGPPEDVLLTVVGANFLVSTQIGFGVFSQGEADAGLGNVGDPKWERTTFVDSQTLTTWLSAGVHPSPDAAIPVVVGQPDGTVSDAINFAFVEGDDGGTTPPDPGPGEGIVVDSFTPLTATEGDTFTAVATGSGFSVVTQAMWFDDSTSALQPIDSGSISIDSDTQITVTDTAVGMTGSFMLGFDDGSGNYVFSTDRLTVT